MLTVHGRTRADKFNGKAEYDTLQNIVKAVDIPVIANGDIDSAEKAARVLDSTGAHGVMIGRAAQGQLWLPGQIAGILRNGIDNRPCAEARLQLAREHCRLLYEFHGAVMGFKIARKHVGWFFEAELGDNYLSFKRAFNALASQDAQEQFFSEESSRILTTIESYETRCPHRKVASEEKIAA